MKITFLSLFDLCEPVFNKIINEFKSEYDEEIYEYIRNNELIDIQLINERKYVRFEVKKKNLISKLETKKYPELLQDILKML